MEDKSFNIYLVVNQFELCKEGAVCDASSVIEGCAPALDGLQHVCGDGRVVNVTTDLATADVLKERHGEGVAHGVEVNIRTDL